MPYGISFDFWNTLYANGAEDQRQNLRIQYFHKILSGYGDISLDKIRDAFKASTRMFYDQWINKQRTPGAPERIQFMCDEIGVKLDDDHVNKSAEYFGKIIDLVPPQKIPHINNLILELTKDYPLAIISDTGYINGYYIRTFLKKEKLLSCFQSQFFSDEHDHCKPHPSVFRMTCDNLSVDCARLIHIGDLEHTDVRGIKDIGGISIKFVGSNDSTGTESQADFVIDDYKELYTVIHKITTR